VPNVSEVASVGGMVKQYQIVLDPVRLRAFLANHRVKVVILDPTHDDGWLPVLARAGLTPHRRDGVLVYPVSGARR